MRVVGMAPEIAGADELEADGFDFLAQGVFLDPVQRLADRDALTRQRRMVGDDEGTAGLKRSEQFAIHLRTIDRHVAGVVVVEQERDQVEILHARRSRIVERRGVGDDVLHCRRRHASREGGLGPLREVARILREHDAVRRHRARHQFAAVAAAGAHIEHLHARTRGGKSEERCRVAALVGLPVGVAAVGRGE
jgi:hypothetical protein